MATVAQLTNWFTRLSGLYNVSVRY